jgi:hypothetical protein
MKTYDRFARLRRAMHRSYGKLPAGARTDGEKGVRAIFNCQHKRFMGGVGKALADPLGRDSTMLPSQTIISFPATGECRREPCRASRR